MNKALKDKAIYLLARREHSRRELTQKLQQRGFIPCDIDPVLDYLEDLNLLNNERFISSLIRVRRNHGTGPLKIMTELQSHGFERKTIQHNEEWQEELWQANARSARIKRFGEALPQTSAERAQQMRFLQQRGFTPEQIRKALDPRLASLI